MMRYLAILLLLFASPVYPATYWIDSDGTQTSLSNCTGSSPREGSTACDFASVDYDGSSIVAGDTVYFRAGTYNFGSGEDGIKPTNSGTNINNRITYSAYNGETVTFYSGHSTGFEDCIDMKSGRDWIVIDGINCSTWVKHLQLWDSSYNEIRNSSFIGMADPNNPDASGSELQDNGGGGSQYNWIHNCVFGKHGNLTASNDDGRVLDIGFDNGDDSSYYNLIEDSHAYHGGHHVLGLHGQRNILRNVYVHNEAWDDYLGTDYGNRPFISMVYEPNDNRPNNLIENNTFAYGSAPADDDTGGDGISMFSPHNIIRYNTIHSNDVNGLWSTIYNAGKADPIGNKVYNNTFYKNGDDPSDQSWKTNWFEIYTHSFLMADSATESHSWEILNNIFWDGFNYHGAGLDILDKDQVNVPTEQNIRDNHYSNGSDPKFVDIAGTPDPMDWPQTEYNFSLQSDSPAINAGGRLTDVATGDDCNGGTGCDSTVEVDDSSFFFDGWGIDTVWPGANINADWICIGTVNNCAQISSINYATDIITLVTALDRNDGDDVWLYKNSSGERVLYGSAPDQGAHEYNGATTTLKGIGGNFSTAQ